MTAAIYVFIFLKNVEDVGFEHGTCIEVPTSATLERHKDPGSHASREEWPPLPRNKQTTAFAALHVESPLILSPPIPVLLPRGAVGPTIAASHSTHFFMCLFI